MNIFLLDKDPYKCARYHNDRHVVKMILETAQLLCTAHVFLDSESGARARIGDLVLRPTHVNHPCARWARESTHNYKWLQELGAFLVLEYAARYHKSHAYEHLMATLFKRPLNIPLTAMGTDWPQCMPDVYKHDNPVEAYRRYYFAEKQHIAKWSPPATVPNWWLERERDIKELRHG